MLMKIKRLSRVNASFLLIALLTLQCIIQGASAKGAAIKSGGSSRRGGSAPSSPSRRPSAPSYPSSSSSKQANPDLTRLSYNPISQSQKPVNPHGGSSSSSSGHIAPSAPNLPSANKPAIGWNLPAQGAPPGYNPNLPSGHSNTKPVGPPSYDASVNQPKYQAPPAYPQYPSSNPAHPAVTSNQYPASPSRRIHHYRPGAVMNSTGGGVHQTPIPASTYPGQHQSMNQGPNYPGSMHPGSYYPQPPPGYPHGPVPAYPTYPAYPGYYPAAPHQLPPNAFVLAPGATLPANAHIVSGPPQSSGSPLWSSLGGSLAGAAIGTVAARALFPGSPTVVQQAPPMSGGAGNGHNEDRIIIINNGPPGTVTSSDGTTVINAGGSQPAQAAGVPTPAVQTSYSPAPAPAPAAPNQPALPQGPDVPLAPLSAIGADVPLAPFVTREPANAPVAAVAGAASVNASQVPPAEPAPGSFVCVQVQVQEPDPADNTKQILVVRPYCYQVPAANETMAADANATSSTVANGSSSDVPLAAMSTSAPMTADGVPLTPWRDAEPAHSERVASTAQLAPDSKVHAASGSDSLKINSWSAALFLLAAYFLH